MSVSIYQPHTKTLCMTNLRPPILATHVPLRRPPLTGGPLGHAPLAVRYCGLAYALRLCGLRLCAHDLSDLVYPPRTKAPARGVTRLGILIFSYS